jgi:hypothetical protein
MVLTDVERLVIALNADLKRGVISPEIHLAALAPDQGGRGYRACRR